MELSEPVPVEKGSLFSVVTEIVSGENAHFKITQDQGNSFLYQNNACQRVLCTPRGKAYTKLSDEKIYYADGKVYIKTAEEKNGIFLLAFYDENVLQDLHLFSADTSKTY